MSVGRSAGRACWLSFVISLFAFADAVETKRNAIKIISFIRNIFCRFLLQKQSALLLIANANANANNADGAF